MWNKLLKSFVIGSSWPAFIIFLFLVSRFEPDYWNFNYRQYSFLAPLYLGIMNALATYLGTLWGLSLRERLLLISLISPSIVLFLVWYKGVYNFETREQWRNQIMGLYFVHFFVFNVIIVLLESSIQSTY